MLLNGLEFALRNNPVRRFMQRRFETARLLEMGGPVPGGRALEMGSGQGQAARLSWTATYDAVFAFGIIHYVPNWRDALAEATRVLKPGGRFFAEEMLGAFITHPVARRFLRHPQSDRFDAAAFHEALRNAGLVPSARRVESGAVAWFTARKP